MTDEHKTITVTISGKPRVGKTVIKHLIAKMLKGANLGYVVCWGEPDQLIDDAVKVVKKDIDPKPEWDGDVRVVMIEDPDGE